MQKVKLGPETLLYPMPAVLVGAVVEGKPNFMTAAWCGIAASTPPAICAALRPARYTLDGINAAGTFSINVPSADLAQKVDYCGIYSGHQHDKSHIFNVQYGELQTAPLIDECPVNLECSVLHQLNLNSHILLIGKIVQTHIRQNCLTDGQPDAVKIDPLIYSTGSQQYHRLGKIVAKAFSVGKENKTIR